MARTLLPPILLLLVAGALAALSLGDRSTALALQLVEWESRLGVGLWWLPGIAGLALLVRAVGSRSTPQRPPAAAPQRGTARAAQQRSVPDPSPSPRQVHRAAPTATAEAPAEDAGPLRAALRDSACALDLPAGARLLVEDSGTVPLRLVLEQCTEHRARRTLEAVAAMLVAGPCPPRLRVEIRDCPQPTTPWHHIVAAAMATSLPRGDARVLRQSGGVDVMLLKPHPGWPPHR